MTTLTARTLITPVGEIAFPAITIDEAGNIADISTDPSIRSESILTPTFLDLHIHGSAGTDVMDATPNALSRMGRFLARNGTAHYLPTTVTAPIDATLHALERLADAIESPHISGKAGFQAKAEARPIGIHLEGPFLSHIKRGVHPAELLQKPSPELFERLQQAARNHIRLLTIAPELPGALDLITHASAQGIRVSLGHSNATAAETEAAIAAGAVSATHLFNAMRPLDHREPGIVGTFLDRPAADRLTPDQPTLFADLICDGIHVHPTLVRLWFAQKQDHAILITDATAATGMGDGAYTLGGRPVTVQGDRCTLTDHPETLAGSVLTLDRAVGNLQAFTGTDLASAIRCASAHPAALLGLPPDPFAPGQPANFNLYTPDGHLQATYLHGQRLG